MEAGKKKGLITKEKREGHRQTEPETENKTEVEA